MSLNSRFTAFFSRKLREKFHKVRCQTDTIKARELLVTDEIFGLFSRLFVTSTIWPPADL